jgi:hydrogenase/urease accessory protein HupE
MNKLVLLSILGSASVAWAHPGHGHEPAGTWAHYLLEPVHLGVGAVSLMLLGYLFRAWRYRPDRRPRG